MAEYQEIFEKMPVGITIHDAANGAILDTNNQFCEMLGYSRDELLSLSFDALHIDEPPYTSERAEDYIRKAATEGPQTFEWIDETKDGTPLPVEVHLRQTTINDHQRILAVVQDISERKRQEERFEAFIQHSMDIIAVLDRDGTFQYRSPSAERITGYPQDAVIGENAFDYIHPDDRDRVREAFRATAASSELGSVEFRYRHHDGSWIWLESVGNNQLDNPYIEGIVVNSREITDRKEQERKLKQQNERLDEFASVVSHDLRTPLSTAYGQTVLAADDCESPHLDGVLTALDQMEDLIDNLLTLARSGEPVGETEVVDLSELVPKCWRNFESDGAELVTETEMRIEADETRFRQLLENLFRNAIEHGGNEVTVEVGELDDGFYVMDDGPGIPADAVESIFEPGYSTTEDGTGFGLSIVKGVAAGHDWEVSVPTDMEAGARFEFRGVNRVD